MPIDQIRPRSYSRKTRLKAETLYLVHGLSPREIAEKLDITPQSVSNLAYKHGWAEKRRLRESQALARAEDRVAATNLEFVESVAVQGQEMVERGFQFAREASGEDREKAFAMAMKGTQIAVQLSRQALGLDASGAAGNGAGGSIALVFARFPDAAEPSERRVDPVDVETSNVSESVILDFDESQQGENDCAESAELIGKPPQVVEKRATG